MKKFVFCKGIFVSLLMSIAAFNASAENFRVRKVIPVKISEKSEEQRKEENSSVIAGISDALFITLPKDMTFISGIELSLKVPEEIAVWRDSVAYIFYENVSPQPSEGQLNYSGDKIFIKTIPSKLSLILDIPLATDFSIKENPYSIKISSLQNYQKGIFLRFQQVMKGVPEELEAAEIEITAKPILRNKGILSLSFSEPSSDEKKYSVYIDEKPIENQNPKKIMLDTGEHHLSVSSESYRNELRTFRIEQGKTTVLEVALRGNEPTLRILSPISATVLFDGNSIENTKSPFVVEPGEHTVKFILGDYEILKNITAEKGHSYTVNLDVSAQVSEDE